MNGETGQLIDANDAALRFYGYSIQQMKSMNIGNINKLPPNELDAERQRALKEERKYIIVPHLLAKGEIRTVEVHTTPVSLLNRTYLFSVIHDITNHKQVEEALQASLREKDILIREVHHRVKNNMQVISGLLDLQARASANPAFIEMVKESKCRIRAMALIHEKLYVSKDFTKIGLAGYVRSLSQELFQSHDIHPGKIDLVITADREVYVDIHKAIPCGLILNELISNALEHAFPGERTGTLEIILAQTINEEIEIVVRDNGSGMPDDVEIHRSDTVGLHLVSGLVEEQLDGQMEVRRGAGTEIRIKFPL